MTTSHVAGLAVRNRELLAWPTTTGWPSTPAWWPIPSQGRHRGNGAHRQGRRAACPDNLVGEYPDFASFERACGAASERFNTRVHRQTASAPFIVWRSSKHSCIVSRPSPTRSPSVRPGPCRGPHSSPSKERVTRSPTSSVQRWFSCAKWVTRSSLSPPELTEQKEVARHPVAAKGQMTLHDGHYPPRRKNPERAPKANNPTESEFLALG